MGTQILAPGTANAYSAEQTIPEGEKRTITLKAVAGKRSLPLGAGVMVQLKRADGGFVDGEMITGSRQLDGPLVFRLHRPLQTYAVGADIES